jgi:nitrogen-specific signal transduction histidine kinase
MFVMDTDLKEHILSQSLEGIVITDMDGSILESNETARQMLAWSNADLRGEHVGILFPPASTSHLLPNLMRIAVKEGGFKGEIMMHDAFSDPVMVRLYVDGYPAEDPRYILFRYLDWRETQKIIRQFRESSQMAVLGNLTRSMAHEILNPISIVGVFARRLLDSLTTDSEEEEWARQVTASVEKLESIIETVQTYLDLPQPVFSQGPPGPVLDQALESSREDAQSSGIRTLEEGPGRFPDIYMDPVLLEMAFSAVLRNSIQRMPNGGDLTLKRSSGKDYIRITFEDSGPALNIQQLEEDLSPMHVVGYDRSHLNLAIARRIIDEHGGSFNLGSSTPDGVKVEISLPVDRRAVVRHRIL